MLEDADPTEFAAAATLPPRFTVAESDRDELGAGIAGFTGRLRQGEWLIEICIIASVVLTVIVIFSAGVLEHTTKAFGKSDDPGASATAQDSTKVLGPRSQAILSAGVASLERGLDDGNQALQQFRKILRIASVQSITPASITASPAGTLMQLSAVGDEFTTFCGAGFHSQITDGDVRFARLAFAGNKSIHGCVATHGAADSAGARQFAIEFCVDADSPLFVGGYQRSGVRCVLVMNADKDNNVESGRLQLFMPAVGTPIDDGPGNNYYRMGDELAWNAGDSCAAWILGKPASEGLREANDASAESGGHRKGARPSSELLKELAASISGLFKNETLRK